MAILIKPPAAFNFTECLRFLDRGYDDCLYEIGENRIIKPILINRERNLLQICEIEGALKLEFLTSKIKNKELIIRTTEFVQEWFDLLRDLSPFYELLNKNEYLSFLSERYKGLRLMGIPDLFEALCWCVIGQQINLSFAHRLKRRFVENFGSTLLYKSKTYYYFPTPADIANLQIDDLKVLQFSRQKAEYIIGIAKKFKEGMISKEQLSSYNDTAQMKKKLIQLKGVGEWTANYVLMKTLKRMDCITFGDSGLNQAISFHLGFNRKPTRGEVENFFAPYNGWQSYLNIYLWRSLS